MAGLGRRDPGRGGRGRPRPRPARPGRGRPGDPGPSVEPTSTSSGPPRSPSCAGGRLSHRAAAGGRRAAGATGPLRPARLSRTISTAFRPSFADLDPALTDLGISWGAAKAFEHRRPVTGAGLHGGDRRLSPPPSQTLRFRVASLRREAWPSGRRRCCSWARSAAWVQPAPDKVACLEEQAPVRAGERIFLVDGQTGSAATPRPSACSDARSAGSRLVRPCDSCCHAVPGSGRASSTTSTALTVFWMGDRLLVIGGDAAGMAAAAQARRRAP